jgi:hypothetical protein
MLLLVGRFFLFFLLIADWVGDPYFGCSPLSRPFSSQEAFCHSAVHRANMVRAITPSRTDILILQPLGYSFLGFDASLARQLRKASCLPLSATASLYALMSLQC